MQFTTPLPFLQALKKLGSKTLAPTPLGSAEIRDQWDADLRERSLFSARTTNAGYLQDVKDRVQGLLGGHTNMATARAELQDSLDALGYQPDEDKRGGLQDLSSDKRINLVLDTNTRQVANWAFREQGQSDQALYAFPAWELVRIAPRSVPRGEKRGKGGAIEPDPENAWEERWQKAGGELVDGDRMIARKDSDVWDNLGDSDTFDDGLDQPYAPFAFNSGMGVREVDREEAIRLGVIDEDTDIQGSQRSMNEGLTAGADLDPEFLRLVHADLGRAIANVAVARISNPQLLRNRLTALHAALSLSAA